MKNVIKISAIAIVAIIVANKVQAQQRASDKSFNAVLMEVKQQQAARNKMIQQMRQSRSNNSLQGNSASSVDAKSVQQATPEQAANRATPNNQAVNSPTTVPVPVKSANKTKQ